MPRCRRSRAKPDAWLVPVLEQRIFMFHFPVVLVLVLILDFFGVALADANFPYERAAGNFDDEILARVTVHALAHAAFAGRRDETRDVITDR